MKCPGQDSRFWKPGAIFDVKCPECGEKVEFFKDDTTRKCGACGHRFVNPDMDFGCAAYCQFAEKCIGDLPPEVAAQRESFLKDKVAIEVKRYFKNDFKRIGHASRVARHAEKIGKAERGNMAVILVSAYLHDIGIPEAERKYKSSAAKYQHEEGPPVARSILENLGANEKLIEEVCDIVGRHHQPGNNESKSFKVVFDADLIANLEEKQKDEPLDADRLETIIANSFLTESGRKEARNIFLEK